MSLDAVAQAVADALCLPDSRRDRLGVIRGGSGGNSRVYIVTLDKQMFVAKQYFRHPSDRRDRLQAEWGFLEYAARAAIGCVPRPVARDPDLGIGIYEYIQGRNLGALEVSAEHVREAARFFLALNDPKHRGAAANRSEEHTSELQSQSNLVCRLLLEKKKKKN